MATISNLTNTLPLLHIRNLKFLPSYCRFSLSSLSCALPNSEPVLEAEEAESNNNSTSKKSNENSYFPKRGQTLELVCESLAYKGKGLCKVTETGFVVMCDRALPGERFIARVTRKKGNYAEATKLKTLTPPRDIVDAPCIYSSHCGGCKTQNLSYEAQLKAKEDQVCDLIIHVGKFSRQELESNGIMKPIVPCDIQFHYRNKVS